MAIEWCKEFEFGIEEIDSQHKKLVSIINDIENVMLNHSEEEVIEDITNELLKYGNIHFQTEELYLLQFNSDDYDDHCLRHATFYEELVNILPKIHDDDEQTIKYLFTYLKKWLIEHISTEDKKYVELFKNNGVK